MSTSRRQFLTNAAGLAALTALLPRAWSQQKAVAPSVPPAATPPVVPLFTISLAEWSLHRALQSGSLDHLDFPSMAKRQFDIDAVEYVNSFFKDKATDAKYLAELKARCDDLGVQSLLIMCDGEGALGDADAGARAVAVTNHQKWLDAAKVLGCHSIRVNAHGEGSRDDLQARVAESLHALALYGDERGLNVIVENHGGTSSDGAWLAATIRKADHPRAGTLPDFGNFDLGGGQKYDRYQGVGEMMPFAKAVSAKSYDFDDKGEETTIQFKRMLEIVVKAGYHGHLGIEYEGARLSEPVGIRRTKELLERVRKELA